MEQLSIVLLVFGLGLLLMMFLSLVGTMAVGFLTVDEKKVKCGAVTTLSLAALSAFVVFVAAIIHILGTL